jgi:hypothetical protein
MSALSPTSSRLVPNKKSRTFHLERNNKYFHDQFESYNDWFYFIHIDPVIRWWHASGMVAGLGFYALAAFQAMTIGLSWTVFIEAIIGVFFNQSFYL